MPLPEPYPARVSENGVIQDWLLLGPMPTAGLTLNTLHEEAHIRPNRGEIFASESWSGSWQTLSTTNGLIDVRTAWPDYTPRIFPPGYPDIFYLHAYLTTRIDTTPEILITGTHAGAHLFINNRHMPLRNGRTRLKLHAGTHSLLIKCAGLQRTDADWTAAVRIAEPGLKSGNCRYFLNDPHLAPAELYFRNAATFRPGNAPSDRIGIELVSASPTIAPMVWRKDSSVVAFLKTGYRADFLMMQLFGPAQYASWNTFNGSIVVDLLDFWGRTVHSHSTNLFIKSQLPVPVRLEYENLEKGHYTLNVTILDGDGRKLTRRSAQHIGSMNGGANPFQFSVVSGELNQTPAADSKFGSNLMLPAAHDRQIRLLKSARLLGSRLHMPAATGSLSELNRLIAAASEQRLPLGQEADNWIQLWNGRTAEAEVLPSAADMALWKISANSMQESQAPISIDIPDLQKNKAILIGPEVFGADTQAVSRLYGESRLATNIHVNLRTYSWGYIDEPDLVTSPVTEHLASMGVPAGIVIGHSGHDRGYPSNGTLGQAQQLSKWLVYAIQNKRLRLVMFNMDPTRAWSLLAPDLAPYPAWSALRTTALLLDGATPVAPPRQGQASHQFAFKKDNKTITALWHDGIEPVPFTSTTRSTLVNVMDHRHVLQTGESFPVDRTPVFIIYEEKIKETPEAAR